ncbi:hypothetical protein GCM10023205_54170 [Yinghuangia aomiensis]|uniref:Uncharacterized protein n=1 Tax=Yinghuangia aomiensis TaxID=676205 RepID=A0ABP9HUY2_9ACTN
MAGSMLDLSIRIYLAMPGKDPVPLPPPTATPDTKQPFSPSNNVGIDSSILNKLHDMLGWVQLGAWTVVMVGLIGCGAMMAGRRSRVRASRRWVAWAGSSAAPWSLAARRRSSTPSISLGLHGVAHGSVGGGRREAAVPRPKILSRHVGS